MRIKEIDGLPVVDAKRPVSFTIGDRDILGADTKEPGNCAVARACRRELSVIEARVHLSRIYLRTNKSNWVRYVTPTKVRSEIIAFDRGGQFDPIEVKLHAPAKNERLGTPRRGGKASGRGKKRVRAYHITTNVRNGPA